MKIKKGDQVKIISGNDKGKQGRVAAVFLDGERVVVEGVAMKKKHLRPRQAGKKGETTRIPAAISVSRVMLVCASCSRPARVKYEGTGKNKMRVCRHCGKAT